MIYSWGVEHGQNDIIMQMTGEKNNGRRIDLVSNLEQIVADTFCSPQTKERFRIKLEQGKFTREDNPESHFSAFFLPFNPNTGKVFLGDHIKSGLWLSPGGHMDRGELPIETAIREANEELGLEFTEDQIGEPFFINSNRY